MAAKDLATQVQFPSVEMLIIGAIFGTVIGLVVGLWLKNAHEKRLIEINNISRKTPYMSTFKKNGPMTGFWRMIGT